MRNVNPRAACDLTPERSRGDETLLIPLRVKPQTTGHPLDPVIGILVSVFMGSAVWVLLAFALRSVIVLARR